MKYSEDDLIEALKFAHSIIVKLWDDDWYDTLEVRKSISLNKMILEDYDEIKGQDDDS